MFFVDARYMSAMEAFFRLLEFNLYAKSHFIYRLQIHDQFRQMVIFVQGQEQEAADAAQDKDTMLTAWFKLNLRDPEAARLLYVDIPFLYVFDPKEREWHPRQNGEERVLSRIFHISPQQVELYHLRLLLLHIRGTYKNI